MANSPIAGTADLKIGGVTYAVAGDFEYDPSTVTRETLTGQDTVHGFSEKPRAPYLSANLRDMGGLSIADINAMQDVSIVVELGNGKTLSAADWWSVGEHASKAEDGTFPARWEGVKLLELT